MISTSELDKVKQLAGEIIETLGFKFSEIDAEVFIADKTEGEEQSSEMINLQIKGDDLVNLIGRYGKTLFAFQHILTMAYNAGKDEGRIRIIVDINDYREQREKELKSYADRALAEVKQTNLPMALPPMKPVERRIIHLALKEEEGIITTSEGEEPNRYVVIKPV
ncbi:KH domain-containing protein [Candidatus Dojkabacteria bacterium]|nr:KH domain-containing protein [Candidatus Dojkabacteria bacterium]